MSTPLPYNVTLTDQSAIIRFFPHRDGAVDDNWNTTYSDSSFAEWSYDNTFGKGVSYIAIHAAVIQLVHNSQFTLLRLARTEQLWLAPTLSSTGLERQFGYMVVVQKTHIMWPSIRAM